MASLPDSLKSAPVGRETLSREELATHQRRRVAEAAVPVFAKRGYQSTTVEHIVGAAKVGVGSFYALFDGKEDCFLEAYDQIVAEGRHRILASLDPGDPWPQRLAACLRALLELIEAEPLAARIAFIEAQTAGAKALARYQRHLEEAAADLRSGRVHSSAYEKMPSTLEFATVGGLAWFLQQRVAMGEAATATRLLPEVLEIAAEPYLGEDATAELVASQR